MRLELDGEEVGAGESWQDNEGRATCTDSGYEGGQGAYRRKRSKYREKMIIQKDPKIFFGGL